MHVAGIDEAGRGPVIGPLLIAGVLMKEEDLPKLKELGVKDSKLLSPKKREYLAQQIRKLVLKCHCITLSPIEIDKVVERGRKLHKLNRLEAQAMAKMIRILKPDIVYVDASDVLADRFKEHIVENLHFNIQIVSEHKADIKYPVVSAASIIAKVERDRAIQKLREKYGDIGSGYVVDPKTIEFLKKWITKFGSYPDFVRKSWKPAKKLKSVADGKQTKIS
jgi:ribonuclease HII